MKQGQRVDLFSLHGWNAYVSPSTARGHCNAPANAVPDSAWAVLHAAAWEAPGLGPALCLGAVAGLAAGIEGMVRTLSEAWPVFAVGSEPQQVCSSLHLAAAPATQMKTHSGGDMHGMHCAG